MIERLHRKFIFIAMGSLFLILVVILGGINGLNLYYMDRMLDGAIQLIADHDGQFPEYSMDIQSDGFPRGFVFQMSPETQYETRYFIVRFHEHGTVAEVDIDHIAAIDEAQATEHALDILSSGKTGGYLGWYKYQMVESKGQPLLIALDSRLQLQSAKSFFYISCMVGVISLLLMFLLVSWLSRLALRPVEESLEKQKQFITDAGHEIKTPLAIIASNADVLDITTQGSEWTTSIRRQVGRLDFLVKRLLTLSSLDENRDRRHATDFSISDVARDAADGFRAIAGLQQKDFQIDIAPNLTVHGDEGEIGQAIAILLDNAVKYSSTSGVIRLHLGVHGKNVVLAVGNSLETMLSIRDPNRLFDRFYREDAARSCDSGGYGLGLSIAKAIAQTHGGDLNAVLEQPLWISFHMTLPQKQGA